MTADDAARWQAARTLADLGELTALWADGDIRWTPVHPEPDEETRPLLGLLATVNRAGFVTEVSQPGEPRDEQGSAQRAAIAGFASGATFTCLMAAAADADLIITAARATSERWGPCVAITLDCGEEFTWFGGAQSRSDLEYAYGRWCHSSAVEALCRAWQITLIDPEWGRNDALWPALARFAEAVP
jgi:hypothetical protein